MDNKSLLIQIIDFLIALFAKSQPAPAPKLEIPTKTADVPKPEAAKVEIQHISLKELNPHEYATNSEIDKNLAILLKKINTVRNAYGSPMTVTSGLRDSAQQAALIAAGKSNAPKSHHLAGEAVDIADADKKLSIWVANNVKLMEEVGFWFEDFSATPTWVHFQIVPPKSGKRFFIP